MTQELGAMISLLMSENLEWKSKTCSGERGGGREGRKGDHGKWS